MAPHGLDDGWASCAITQNGFVRIISRPRYPSPISTADAVELLGHADDNDSYEFWTWGISLLADRMVTRSRLYSPRQVTDSYLLALAVSRGGVLVTFDRSLSLASVNGATQDHLVVLQQRDHAARFGPAALVMVPGTAGRPGRRVLSGEPRDLHQGAPAGMKLSLALTSVTNPQRWSRSRLCLVGWRVGRRSVRAAFVIGHRTGGRHLRGWVVARRPRRRLDGCPLTTADGVMTALLCRFRPRNFGQHTVAGATVMF